MIERSWSLGRWIAIGLGTTLLAAGGVAFLSRLAPDDFSTWSQTPLPPDLALFKAARSDQTCQARGISDIATPPPPLVLPMQVVLQDRRTPRTAGFVVTTDGYVGVCLLSPAGEGQGYLVEGPLPSMADAIAVEGGGGGILGAGKGSYIWGRADRRIGSVTIDLVRELHVFDDDDRLVSASLGGGYWFGWWPDGANAYLVTGFDAQGDAIVSLKLFDDGWVAQ